MKTLKNGLLTILIILLAVCASTCANKKNTGPAIQFDKELIVFGDIKEGSIVNFNFIFTNPGTEILLIEELELSCWCVEVQEWDRIIEPGSQGKIAGIIKSEGFKGEIVKTITLTTNLKTTAPVLTLKANVIN